MKAVALLEGQLACSNVPTSHTIYLAYRARGSGSALDPKACKEEASSNHPLNTQRLQ